MVIISCLFRYYFFFHWSKGDGFIKIGDEYPFLFTVYTAAYAKEQCRFYGEEIKPSSRDIILKRKHLTPEDILRAVIKWVNLYFPDLRGKPVFLEKLSVLQTLVCDPGVEVTLPEPI